MTIWNRRTAVAALGALAMLSRCAGAGAGLSDPAHHHHRAVRGGRADRRRHAPRRRADVEDTRPADHRRKRGRRRRHDRREPARRGPPTTAIRSSWAISALMPRRSRSIRSSLTIRATDFEPVALINGAAIVVVAKKDLPPKDLKEFIAYLKANETKVNQAHAGVGAVSYITCELLNGIIGIKPVGVPFQGTGPAMNALVGGQVDYMCDQITNVVPQVNGGTIKAYAVATRGTKPVAAERADHGRGGLPNYQASAWNALFAPKGTPKAIIDKVNAAAAKALDDPKVIARMNGTRQRHPEAGAAQARGARQAGEGRSRQVGASSSSRSAENARLFRLWITGAARLRRPCRLGVLPPFFSGARWYSGMPNRRAPDRRGQP